MTANRQEESRLHDTSSTDSQTVDRSAATQVGQVLQGLGSLTHRLPLSDVGRRVGSRNSPAPSNEQIAELVVALGEPQHPDHARAMELLVKIGRPAIPFLIDALQPQHSWLTTYRAAEALGCIGSGQATGALIKTLQHPNSNVRWSAVRALAQIGDVRALFEMRRVAHDDHGRTSWGESVAGAAQSALDQIQANSIWSQSLELFKTAVTCVLMILSLILAFSVVTTLRQDLQQIGKATPQQIEALYGSSVPVTPAAESAASGADDTPPADEPASAPLLEEPPPDADEPQPVAPADAEPAAESDSAGDDAEAAVEPGPGDAEVVGGSVLNAANVRPAPTIEDRPVGFLSQGDEVEFLARSPDNEWYLVQLGSSHADGSFIDNPDGSESGWVHRMLVSAPEGDLPVIDEADDAPTEGDNAAPDETLPDADPEAEN